MELLAAAAAGAAATVVALRWRRRMFKQELVVDEQVYAAKVAALNEGGLHSLSVILDFDRTMSTYWAPGRKAKGRSCHGILEAFRSPSMKARAEELNAKYFPLETSPNLSMEEKTPLMIDWYDAINGLLIADGLRREDVASAVAQSGVVLRDGVAQIIDFCGEHHVPLLVFSAGIGDVLQEVLLQRYGLLPPEVIIVSNWMRFDADGALVGWSRPVLHMFNKNEGRLLDDPSFVPLLERANVVLAGDSLGDAAMADGGGHALVLRFGLLNDGIQSLLAQYSTLYDVVLLDDAPLFPALAVLRGVAEAAAERVAGGVPGEEEDEAEGAEEVRRVVSTASTTGGVSSADGTESGDSSLAVRLPAFAT